MTAKLNDVDPQGWLADVLARINDHAIDRLDQQLPWNWKPVNGPRKLPATADPLSTWLAFLTSPVAPKGAVSLMD